MDNETYITLHHSADRLALEAARTVPDGKEAGKYIETYQKAIEHLISEYEKHNPKNN